MKKCESIFIIKGRINEEKAKKEFGNIVKEYSKIVGIIKADFVGKKKLIYSIRNNAYGYYCVIDFEVENDNILINIGNILRKHNENFLKFITVKGVD